MSNKLTDKDIIKALECCNVETDCKRCPLYKEHSANCIDIACKNALDLINRQQLEIENLKVENQSLRTAANSLKMHYEEAQAQIERLEKETKDKERAYNDEFLLRKEWQTKCRELLKEKQTVKSEVIKEFAERLKEYATQGFWETDAYVGAEQIDNLVKELVGDSDDS